MYMDHQDINLSIFELGYLHVNLMSMLFHKFYFLSIVRSHIDLGIYMKCYWLYSLLGRYQYIVLLNRQHKEGNSLLYIHYHPFSHSNNQDKFKHKTLLDHLQNTHQDTYLDRFE